jgi:hypothetical protein
LHVATRIGTSDYYWIQPATVVAGRGLTMDLDNSNVHQLTLGCVDAF